MFCLAFANNLIGGEGCSTAGGCATCPFMKMNNLDALMDVVANADQSGTVSGEDGCPTIPTIPSCFHAFHTLWGLG